MVTLRSMGPRLRGDDNGWSAEYIRLLRLGIKATPVTAARARYCGGCLTYSTVPAITVGQERNSRSGSHLTALPSVSVAVML